MLPVKFSPHFPIGNLLLIWNPAIGNQIQEPGKLGPKRSKKVFIQDETGDVNYPIKLCSIFRAGKLKTFISQNPLMLPQKSEKKSIRNYYANQPYQLSFFYTALLLIHYHKKPM